MEEKTDKLRRKKREGRREWKKSKGRKEGAGEGGYERDGEEKDEKEEDEDEEGARLGSLMKKEVAPWTQTDNTGGMYEGHQTRITLTRRVGLRGRVGCAVASMGGGVGRVVAVHVAGGGGGGGGGGGRGAVGVTVESRHPMGRGEEVL